MRIRCVAAGAFVLAGVLSFAGGAQALTMKECSAKYKAAEAAGTLKGQKWNDFRKAECGSEAAATPAAAPAAAPAPKPAATTAAKPAPAPAPAKPAAAAAKPAPNPSAAVFPTAVSPKYSKESAGKARMHTCLDQYDANKANSGTGNAGLEWIMKGGGYYSECNKRLKG